MRELRLSVLYMLLLEGMFVVGYLVGVGVCLLSRVVSLLSPAAPEHGLQLEFSVCHVMNRRRKSKRGLHYFLIFPHEMHLAPWRL
jgi:hypothetical protein